jgi:hypothetical protein
MPTGDPLKHWLKFSVPLWDAFVSRHKLWIEARVAEGADLFCIPIAGDTQYRCAFETSHEQTAAENAFTRLCRELNSIGVATAVGGGGELTARFIQYKGLVSPPPGGDLTWLESGRNLGWTEA